MKFTCDQQILAKALNIVSRAVSMKTTIPVLKGILLEVTEENILKMTASDLEITIEKTVRIEGGEPGSIVVPAKLFSDIIRKLPPAPVYIFLEDKDIKIKCLSSDFLIVCFPADEFPNIVNLGQNKNYISFDKNLLKDMIRKTSFAASIDESKGVITGILVELTGSSVNMVAIDGYRMAITREPMFTEKSRTVIPAKIMNEISKILSETDDTDDEVRLITDDKSAMFATGDVRVILRLLEGEFIRYKDILPKDSKTKIKAARNSLAESIERASLLSKEGKNNLIRFSMKGSVLTITSRSEEGTVKEEIPVEKEGDDLDIGFNAKYILDVLKAINDEEIIMLFKTAVTSCLIHPIDGNKYEYLVLPVRLMNS